MIDTHVHVVSDDKTRYPLRLYGESDWVHEFGCSAERYATLMDEAEVTQAVLVQAVGAYTDDNRYCVDAANADPERFAAVVYVDLHDRGALDALGRWAGAGASGVRLVAGAGPDPVPVLDGRLADAFAAADELGLRVLLTTFAAALGDVARLLEDFASTPVALDHCAFPDLTDGAGFPHARPLFALAELPEVHCKVSTNVLDLAGQVGEPATFVAALAAAYGAERLQWGSDWSHTHDRTFPELVQLARDAFSILGDDAHWALADAARGFWPGLAGPGEARA